MSYTSWYQDQYNFKHTKDIRLVIALIADDRPDLLKLRNLPSKNGSINVIERIGTDYFAFRIHLLNDAIVAECRENAEKINLEILKLWIKGRGKPVSWNTLIRVLRVIGLKALADDIEDSLQQYTFST